MKLQTKLPLLLVPLIILPMLVVNLLAYSHLKNNAEQQAFRDVIHLLDLFARESEAHITNAVANARLFANDPLLKYYLQTDSLEERYSLMQLPLLKELTAMQEVFDDYLEILILHPNGTIDLQQRGLSEESLSALNPGTLRQIAELSNQAAPHTSIRRHPSKPTLVAEVSMPLYYSTPGSPSGKKLYGHLLIIVDASLLNTLLDNNPIGVGGGIVLSDAEGNILAAPDHLDFSTAAYPGDAGFSRLPERVMERQMEPGAQIPELIDIYGQEFYVGSNLFHEDLMAHILMPKEELLLTSRDISLLVAVVTLISILIAVPLLLYLLRHQIVRPLEGLKGAFQQVGTGSKPVEIITKSDDELGDICQSFNQMSRLLSKSNAQIRALAFEDTLTGLPNRHQFGENLKQIMKECKEQQTPLALLFLDLDNFKDINDSLGHQSGDMLLKQVARLLEHNLREQDLIAQPRTRVTSSIARLGGDEFIILLPGLKAKKEASLVATRIIKAMNTPIKVQSREFRIGVSIGITVYPEDGDGPQDLIKNADMAMYQAKKHGKNNFQYYSESMSADSIKRIVLEQKLRKAVETQAFELYYQPQVESRTQQVISAEALIRWYDEELGMVSPEIFIPLAEETGLIAPIGRWVLETACQQVSAWHQAGLPKIQVAVNVSSLQLSKSGLLDLVEKTLVDSGLEPQYLHIELTESAILSGREDAIKTLELLRQMGILVALDDFGTGYSSLSYLRTLPIDILKIDRSFINEIHQQRSAPILSAIIAMAHALQLTVVAEGIERQSQIDFMTLKQCDVLQGYIFSRPLKGTDMAELLKQQVSDARYPALPEHAAELPH